MAEAVRETAPVIISRSVPGMQHQILLEMLGLSVTGQMSAGDLVVGCGTLALALFTFLSVRAARAGLDAQDAPMVIGVHVPDDSPIAGQFAPFSFSPPFAGRLPDGYSPQFVLRLWNVGRGPALIRDVQLNLAGHKALGPLPSQLIINPGGVFDGTWATFSVPPTAADGDLAGTLRITYAHSNGVTFQTTSRVEMRAGALNVRTIDRGKVSRRAHGALRSPARIPAWSASEAYLVTLRSWRRSRR